jgi:putative acetyltransferase
MSPFYYDAAQTSVGFRKSGPLGIQPALFGGFSSPIMNPACQVMEIRRDAITDTAVIDLLQEHLRCMRKVSPPESVHALDLGGLRGSDITFWTIWDGENLAGCGALKELDALHGEIKSMRTAYAYQRKGIARLMLQHLIREAKTRGYDQLSLETGSMDYFEPARKLYAGVGFEFCEPFASYKEDSNSMFMTRKLESPQMNTDCREKPLGTPKRNEFFPSR